MLKIFEVCLGTGAIFTAVSFVLSHVLNIGQSDIGSTDIGSTDIDMNFDTNIDTHPDASITALKPTIILAFITTFGGIGMICIQKGLNDILATLLAVVVAFVISLLINRFILIPLNKAQNTSAISQKVIRGSLGKLTVGISGSSFGRVNYVIGSNSYNSPAKSYDGKDIEKGSDVIIIEIKKRVFYVKKFYYEKISYGLHDE